MMKRGIPVVLSACVLASCAMPDAFQGTNTAALAAAKAEVPKPRADFLKLIDRPRVPLASEFRQTATANGTVEFHFTYTTEKGQTVPGILLKSATATGRQPVVIALHGTGGKKE